MKNVSNIFELVCNEKNAIFMHSAAQNLYVPNHD